MTDISIYGSHDASICFSPAVNKYRIYELERLTKERFFSLSDVSEEKFKELIHQTKNLFEKEYGPQQYHRCFYNEMSLTQLRILSSIFNITLFKKVGHHLAHAASSLYQSPFDRSLIFSLAQGATRYNLSKTNLLKLELPIPNKVEQDNIALTLMDIDKLIQKYEIKLQKLKLQKQGTMQALLTGKIRLV